MKSSYTNIICFDDIIIRTTYILNYYDGSYKCIISRKAKISYITIYSIYPLFVVKGCISNETFNLENFSNITTQ